MFSLPLIICFLLLFVADAEDPEKCRELKFVEILEGKSLKGHVIRSIDSENDEMCSIMCFMEERCVSYNYGKGTCELNDSDRISHPKDLVQADDTIYLGSENHCKDHRCPLNATCLVGYTSKGYMCKCPLGLKGENCDKVDCLGFPEASSGTCCVLPFIYKGVTYQDCFTGRFVRPWCATVPNYDINKKWGFCSGYIHLKIESQGADDPGRTPPSGRSIINVNRKEYSLYGRGHNIVAINPNTTIHSRASFDTWEDQEAGNKMRDYINSLPTGTTVLVVTQGSSENTYHAASNALKSLGAKDPLNLGDRSSWYLVGYKGKPKPWIRQGYAARSEGPSGAEMDIALQ